VKLAAVPLNVTDVAPLRFVPEITTVVPTGPLVGEKFVIVGAAAVTEKLVALVAVPPGVVTAIGPVVAPEGTVAVTCVDELTVKLAAVPLNVTDVAPVRFVPAITTVVPTGPLVGKKLVIVGAAAVTEKLVALVATPPGVVTAIGPVVAPEGTVAVIWVEESTVKLAAVPLKVTDVAPVRFVPPITTVVPTGPLVGKKLVTVGAATVTEKLVAVVAVPPGVVTEIGPVVAPEGTVAVICVDESTVKLAAVPLKVTDVAPVRLVPVITTLVPTGPLVGLKPLIVAEVTSNGLRLVAIPSGVETRITPSVAPLGTTAVIWIGASTVKLASAPLNWTDVAPERFAPVTTTEVPRPPPAGLNEVIAGEVTLKWLALVKVPPGDVTAIGPVVAPAGTVAVTCVSESTVKLALRPSNDTAVAPVKSLPVIVTVVSTGPDTGENGVTVKSVGLVRVPPGDVTTTGPVAAPGGTVAVTCVSESTVKVALTPPNVTSVAPVKLLPAIVTIEPMGPDTGENGVTVKSVGLVRVPPGDVTTTGPVAAPDGTVAVTCVSESTVKLALTASNVTLVAPVKLLPTIFTTVFVGPMTGENAVTVKSVGLIPLPSEALSPILPVEAPSGTVAVI